MMNFSSDKLEERRLFTYEERKTILKRSHGVCACCGKKLTTKTMTVDHIVPISCGGTNDLENLIALCPECNKEKGNKLYMPRSYYMAIQNVNEMLKIERHVEKWFQSIKDQFDIERFPLIAPVTSMQLTAKAPMKKKTIPYVPSLILNWQIINNDYYAEIEAVTGIDTREIRKQLPQINKFYKESEDGYLPTVALYSLRKRSSDKILAVVAVQVVLEKRHMNVWIPWCELPKKYHGQILYNLVSILLDSLTRIGGYCIDTYTVMSTLEYKHAVADFDNIACTKNGMGSFSKYYVEFDKHTNEPCRELLCVYRQKVINGKLWEGIPKPK